MYLSFYRLAENVQEEDQQVVELTDVDEVVPFAQYVDRYCSAKMERLISLMEATGLEFQLLFN